MNDNLEKAYTFAKHGGGINFPDEYIKAYSTIREAIEKIEATENVKIVMRLRYLDGLNFNEIASKMKITYQWVYELHKIGIKKVSKYRG